MGNFLSLPILILAAALQVSLMPQMSILGGRPDLVLLLVLSWSLNVSLEQGVVWAFVGGIVKDLLSAAPLGTTSFGMVILIFGIHAVRRQLYSVGLFTLIWVVVGGTIFQQLVSMSILLMSGFQPELGFGVVVEELSYILLPTIFYNLVLILPVYMFVRFTQRRLNQNARLYT
ncbi:MAG: rod shape-determining protein MreD [Anaerolineae bacterium]|nr:rod shape-determining protein MreD [Anaerolineae bacterium]